MSGSYWTKRRRVKSKVNKQITDICRESSSVADDFCFVPNVFEQSDLKLTNNADEICSSVDHQNGTTSEDLWQYAETVDILDVGLLKNNQSMFCKSCMTKSAAGKRLMPQSAHLWLSLLQNELRVMVTKILYHVVTLIKTICSRLK